MTAAHPAGSLQPPLAPRDGHTLKVLGIARISTEHQDALSLGDQEALYRQWLAQHAGPPFALTMIAGRGSGECLDREEARRARAEVETGSYDLVIAEDLGRIFRRAHALLFCELCEDYGTRLVAINDNVDTGQDGWRVLAGFASMRHELYNADTSKRIRRSLRNRFQQGGVVQAEGVLVLRADAGDAEHLEIMTVAGNQRGIEESSHGDTSKTGGAEAEGHWPSGPIRLTIRENP